MRAQLAAQNFSRAARLKLANRRGPGPGPEADVLYPERPGAFCRHRFQIHKFKEPRPVQKSTAEMGVPEVFSSGSTSAAS